MNKQFHERSIGKWFFEPGYTANDPRIICKLDSGDFAGQNRAVGTIYRNPDAQLVAAAPDLLAALNRLIPGLEELIEDGTFEPDFIFADAVAEARKAIEKATGVKS